MLYVAVAVTIAVVVTMLIARHWSVRLQPILFLGGAHLLYNTWAISLADTNSSSQQLALTFGTFGSFMVGAGIIALNPSRRTSMPPIRQAEWNSNRYTLRGDLALLVATLSVTTYTLLVISAGALPIFASNPNLARISFFPGGITSTIVTVPLKALAAASAIAYMSSHERSRVKWLLALSASSFVLLAATANRGLVIQPLLLIALFACIRYRLRLRWMSVSALLLLAGFSAAGYQRNLAAYGPAYTADINQAGYEGWTVYMAPALQYLAGTSTTFDRTIAMFPHHVPFQDGRQFFSPLLHLPSVDLYLKDVFGLDFQGFGLALGAMNAFYVDWGYLGAIIGFTIGGMVIQYLYNKSIRTGGIWVVTYLAISVSYLLANYGHPFAYLSTVLTPILAITLLTGRKDQRRTGSEGTTIPANRAINGDTTRSWQERASC